MPLFDMAIIVGIEADNYAEAESITYKMADGIGDTEQIFCFAATAFEYDNDGQRVLYLHPENEPREEDS
jgi:hypothetical protein